MSTYPHLCLSCVLIIHSFSIDIFCHSSHRSQISKYATTRFKTSSACFLKLNLDRLTVSLRYVLSLILLKLTRVMLRDITPFAPLSFLLMRHAYLSLSIIQWLDPPGPSRLFLRVRSERQCRLQQLNVSDCSF